MEKEAKETKRATGRILKLNEGENRENCIKERDEHMMKNKGYFERVYPPENKNPKLEQKYKEILEEAEAMYHRFTGSEKVSDIKISGK